MGNNTSTSDLYSKVYAIIKPEMSLMEAERKKLNKLVVTSGVLGFCFILSIPIAYNFGLEFYLSHKIITIISSIIIGLIVITVLFLLIKSMLNEFKFINNFKEKIIKKIVDNVYGSFHYVHKKHITASKINTGGIFESTSRVTGDDYFQGIYESVDFEFSEVIHGGAGQSVANFHGLYFIFSFPKNINSKLRIWPSKRDFHQIPNIILEDPEFNKLFTVVGDDQVKSRYILSQSFMERYKEFYQKSGREVFMSFVDNKMHLAINFNRKNFEPRLEQTMVNESSIKEIIQDLLFVQNIVKALKLDLKIWGDQ